MMNLLLENTASLYQRDVIKNQSLTQWGIDYVDVRSPVGVPKAEQTRWYLQIHFVYPDNPSVLSALSVIFKQISSANIRLCTQNGQPSPFVITSVNVKQGAETEKFILLVNVDLPNPYRSPDVLAAAYVLEFCYLPYLNPDLASTNFYLRTDTIIDPRPRVASQTIDAPVTAIDYQAKDYASFRQQMLANMSLLLPMWQERHIADIGIMLVEILAYAADYLSYYQDAVATESYLATARLRSSVKRHARLLDYRLGEGCNARTWVQLQVDDDQVRVAKGTPVLSQMEGQPLHIPAITFYQMQNSLDGKDRNVLRVFETMHDAVLFQRHNTIAIFNHHALQYVVPQGATEVFLAGHYPDLAVGDVLIFEMLVNPETGFSIDVDWRYRHPVRVSAIGPQEFDASSQAPMMKIQWLEADRLPKPFPVTGMSKNGEYLSNITSLSGNIVLADSGQSIRNEPLPSVPENKSFQPVLKKRSLVYAEPYSHRDAIHAPAEKAVKQSLAKVIPAVQIQEVPLMFSQISVERPLQEVTIPSTDMAGSSNMYQWQAQQDLLNSDAFARDFTVQVESDGTIGLCFGNGVSGRKPVPGTNFSVTYRIASGTGCNVGAETLTHIVSEDGRITNVRNIMAAVGGTNQETVEQATLHAPVAFHKQKRCVTEADYEGAAESFTGVKQALASFRWTGSWRTLFLYVARHQGKPLTDTFQKQLQAYLLPMQMCGVDLALLPPVYVPLSITLAIQHQVKSSANHIRQALLKAFSNTYLEDGQRGFFDPDNFTFGMPLYPSQVIARALQVEGVLQAELLVFHRLNQLGEDGLVEEKIAPGPCEILRLDNNPNQPWNGTLTFVFEEIS